MNTKNALLHLVAMEKESNFSVQALASILTTQINAR